MAEPKGNGECDPELARSSSRLPSQEPVGTFPKGRQEYEKSPLFMDPEDRNQLSEGRRSSRFLMFAFPWG